MEKGGGLYGVCCFVILGQEEQCLVISNKCVHLRFIITKQNAPEMKLSYGWHDRRLIEKQGHILTVNFS